LRGRITAIYAASTATAAGASRFIELWSRENGKYPRNDKAAERALEALDRITRQPKRSRKAVRRFLADLEAWKRIIDDAADTESEIDATTRRNRAREVYPLPYALLRVLYSGCDRVWKDMMAAGIVVKAEGKGGQYVPNIGRPQYYSIDISE
jgi:transposase-like protein